MLFPDISPTINPIIVIGSNHPSFGKQIFSFLACAPSEIQTRIEQESVLWTVETQVCQTNLQQVIQDPATTAYDYIWRYFFSPCGSIYLKKENFHFSALIDYWFYGLLVTVHLNLHTCSVWKVFPRVKLCFDIKYRLAIRKGSLSPEIHSDAYDACHT